MNTKTEFTPIFLYREEERITATNKLYQEWLVYIQKGLDVTKELFDEPLTDEQLTNIMSGGWKAVEGLMREKLNFPNAKIETLLDLNGKDGTNAKLALNHVVNRSKTINASISSGNVIMSEDVQKMIEQEYTYYTKSIQQNELLEDAKQLSDLMNKLIGNKIIANIDVYQTCFRLKIVESKNTGNENHEVVPNLKNIRIMK
ncbi:hypothetical protein [Formosa haliotis]|uniref:hypothetical protein n=1 Tax=Formosa haliotis TaxID=1555194 RepID=UPI000824737A|nr:hypothetical protein [Formosa haliotis]